MERFVLDLCRRGRQCGLVSAATYAHSLAAVRCVASEAAPAACSGRLSSVAPSDGVHEANQLLATRGAGLATQCASLQQQHLQLTPLLARGLCSNVAHAGQQHSQEVDMAAGAAAAEADLAAAVEPAAADGSEAGGQGQEQQQEDMHQQQQQKDMQQQQQAQAETAPGQEHAPQALPGSSSGGGASGAGGGRATYVPPRRSLPKERFPLRVRNLPRGVLKSDVMEFFADCGVTEEEQVRAEYSELLNYVASWVTLPTEEMRWKALARDRQYLAARRVSLSPASMQEWSDTTVEKLAIHSRGRYLLAIGLPELATAEDVVRFFCGFDLLGNPVTIMNEAKQSSNDVLRNKQNKPADRNNSNVRRRSSGSSGGGGAAVHRAVVRFSSPEEAQRAMRTRHNGYIASNQIKLRLLV